MNGSKDENVRRRYPMSFALKYVMTERDAGRTGAGETLWMSGGEVGFLAKGPAAVGDKLSLHIEWPVLLGGEVPLQLIAAVEIVQRSGPLSVARITKYEFRTRRLQALSLGAVHRLPATPAWQMRPSLPIPAAKAYASAPHRPAALVSAAGG